MDLIRKIACIMYFAVHKNIPSIFFYDIQDKSSNHIKPSLRQEKCALEHMGVLLAFVCILKSDTDKMDLLWNHINLIMNCNFTQDYISSMHNGTMQNQLSQSKWQT